MCAKMTIHFNLHFLNRYVLFMSLKLQGLASLLQVVPSSPSTSLLNKHPRERTPSSCKDHVREERCTDILDLLQVYHTATPSLTSAPRDASSNKLVVVVTAVVTRSKHCDRLHSDPSNKNEKNVFMRFCKKK